MCTIQCNGEQINKVKFPETSSNFSGRKGAMDGWMDGWMGCWLDGWMDGWMDRRMAGSKINIQKTGFFFTGFSETLVILFGLFSCHE